MVLGGLGGIEFSLKLVHTVASESARALCRVEWRFDEHLRVQLTQFVRQELRDEVV